MIGAKLKHDSDRCLLTITAFVQASLFVVVTVLLWKSYLSNSNLVDRGIVLELGIYTILAFIWVVAFFVFLASLFKTSGIKYGKLCCFLTFTQNLRAVILLGILSIAAVLVAVARILQWQNNVTSSSFDFKAFATYSLLAYFLVLFGYVFGPIWRAALKS